MVKKKEAPRSLFSLNQRALRLVEELLLRAEELRVRAIEIPGGGRAIDCGAEAPGGLEAGLALARICLADLAEVSIVPGTLEAPAAGGGSIPLPGVAVWSDHPVTACMASQYAGWAISAGKYFAMGSGPMRAAAGNEALFDEIGRREEARDAVGVLEARKLPGPEVFELVASKAGVPRSRVTLLVAPTASLAGGVQVVSRSVETALHKLHTLGFDLERVVAGHGTAPLPSVARNDLAAIGRTNDAVLYGAEVTLWVRGDDTSLEAIGPRVPSSSSKDHGAPFAEIFERYQRDFYQIDPALFSPAVIVLQNLETGSSHRYGRREPEILRRSLFAP